MTNTEEHFEEKMIGNRYGRLVVIEQAVLMTRCSREVGNAI